MQLTQKNTFYVAVASAALAVIFATAYLAGQKRRILAWGETLAVVVARGDMLEGKVLDESMVAEEMIPKKFVQPGAFGRSADIFGLVTIAPVKKGEQLTDTKVVPSGLKFGLAPKIPPGRRAVAVSVDEITGVSGLIRADNLVDVIATFDFGDELGTKVYTQTILQGIPVLSVGDDLGPGYIRAASKKGRSLFGGAELLNEAGQGSKKRTITLALAPEDVQKLVLAQESASITLSLLPQWEPEKEPHIDATTAAEVTGMHELLRSRSRPIYREYRGK